MEKSAGDEVPLAKVTIKKEALNDDIKEFAETAMNELLGWYGYGNNREARGACRSHSGSNSSGPESPKFNEGCGWCGKAVDESTALSSAAATFCSELCFSQSRRANFKKNKTCDWCRHVRHTVSYVDSQDGTSQLQFCSDKCLNQYKMHIFWRETRAHLEIHPHLQESSSGTLITPDLWMNKCKSPDASSPSSSPAEAPQQTSPLPLITVAHPSKLMPSAPPEPERRQRSKMQKKSKKKAAKPFLPEMPQDLRVRHSPEFEALRPEEAKPPEPRPSERRLIDSLVPPPTVLVPYPIILPLPVPIPIPIPLPISSSLLNNNKKDRFKEVSSQTEEETRPSQIEEEESEKVNTRPLRKRKRIVEKKSRFVIKSKKLVST